MHRIWTSTIGVLIYLLVLILNDVPLTNAQQYPPPPPRSRERKIEYKRFMQTSLHENYTTRKSTSTTVQRGDQSPPRDDDFEDRLAAVDDVDGFYPINEAMSTTSRRFDRRKFFTWPLKTSSSTSTTTTTTDNPYHYRVYRPPPKVHPCEQSSCYPATGNLLIGREQRLTASSTCGLRGPERFCIVSHLEEKKCFLCDTREATRNDPLKNHRIGQLIYKTKPGTREQTWWQSENGVENVTIQLDLEAEFHFTHLIIIFGTFRPSAMVIERSYDFGQSWHIYRHFAHNCLKTFPDVPSALSVNTTITDVVCDQRYSGVEPSKNGEIIFRVLPPNMKIKDPYADHIQNMLKMTNLRIKFQKLHTLGDTLLDDRNEIQEKYYYAISSMVVRGSCSCYGHASRCLPLEGVENLSFDMVHGRCECTHNTKGLNCEDCEDFYNDLPWKPAFGKQTNSCRKCNCNNHATSCHYDEAVFQQSFGTSGGVCDNCQHNTMGQHCEQCIQFFYRDPNEDIESPYVCRPCDCDPRGSNDEGICDSITDKDHEMEAGACHCKDNVKGRRCDTCKDGFWNLTESNDHGCQSCTCNILGTVNNLGCNTHTGECDCKRFVIGKDCNECQPEFFGLSDIQDGCTACDCHETGAYERQCDEESGQCRCRPHMTGRTCSTPGPNHFVPDVVNVLEAEIPYYTTCESHSSYGNCTVVGKEPPYGSERESTGPGYLKAYEGSTITVTTNPIPSTLQYDIVIRYQTAGGNDWERAYIHLVRPDEYDPDGPCANSHPQYETDVPVTLSSGQISTSILQDICLEKGKTYKLKITFETQSFDRHNPAAHILIDSLVLVPRIEVVTIPQAPEDLRQRFTILGCNQTHYETNYQKHIRPECSDLLQIISIFVHDGASPCNCDLTGSMTKQCDKFGGHCQCKPNVIGRQCDQCAPGTYGFGPEGCKACDCNSIGAKDNDCNRVTGQCDCQPNTYGRACNQCQNGYWNFPNCQICDCNGHASNCDSRSGECTNCQDFTAGFHCDQCIDQYYGNPLLGSDIGCRPCRCPDTKSSNHTHAEACAFDPRSNDMICYCERGYTGARCDVCDENYYGYPEVRNGTCESCECNGNVDPNAAGNCDHHSGKCLQCLHNTAGDNCEYCADGFYGDALTKECRPCDCDVLGTDPIIQHCDRYTGQCPCLPNVEGPRCDRCLKDFWKIASGEGCEPCGCDFKGSLHPQCNPYNGQCECNSKFGGRQCDQCQANHWGNPNQTCYHCQCNIYGSASQQCNRETGKCACNSGMGGDKCDICARGFYGEAPYCEPCDECFDNWDLILDALENQTDHVIAEAKTIKITGATGAYTKEFDEMEKKVKDIKKLVDDSTIDPEEIKDLNARQTQLRNDLNSSLENLQNSEKTLEDVSSAINLANVKLDQLKKKSDDVKSFSAALKENATMLQEANDEGALNLTRAALDRVLALQDDEAEILHMNAEAERFCKRIEATIIRNKENIISNLDANQKQLDDYEAQTLQLTQSLPDLNEKMCDGRGNPCDDSCGGAGCDKCGGLSCDKGALSRAEKANEFAKETEANMKRKEEVADNLIRSMVHARANATKVHQDAERLFDEAQKLLNETAENKKKGNQYMDELIDLINNNTASPEEIQDLADKTLKLELQLDQEQINTIANQIDDTVRSLQDVDTIIYNTRNNLYEVEDLKLRANKAKDDADKVLETANEVVKALEETEEAQVKATEAIGKANVDIQLAKNDLEQINSKTAEGRKLADEQSDKVNKLFGRVGDLNKRIVANDLASKAIKEKAEGVEDDAQATLSRAQTLSNNYKHTNNTLTDRAKSSEAAIQRTHSLLQRATQITVDTNEKLNELNDMVNGYQTNEQELTDLQGKLDELNTNIENHLKKILNNANYYRDCSA